jgi:Spy/CpxP family protein refolding chaperone
MKNILSFPRVALAALVLGTATASALMADDATTTPTTGTTPAPTCSKGWKHHNHEVNLTDAEKAQLKKAHDAAIAANPSLQTEGDSLKQQFEALKGSSATEDQKKALREQGRAYHEKLRAAELQIDPTLAPIFAKLETGHKHHHTT